MVDKLYDVIWLQPLAGSEELWLDDQTWCSDQINPDDTKYLLATPEREAAPELLEALQNLVMPYKALQVEGAFRTCPHCFITLYTRDKFEHAPECEVEVARAAIAKATKEADGG